MTYFLIAPATKTNSLRKNELSMSTDIKAVADAIVSSTNGSTPPHLFFIAIKEETISVPRRNNAHAKRVIQKLGKEGDTLRVVPLKSAAFGVLKDSGLIDLLPVELFNSLAGQVMFKRSVCEHVVKTVPV